MSNSKISALSANTTLADADELVVASSGATKKITALNLKKDASFTKATSMPGTPATNQMCFRTDLGILFYYDGTRWLSVDKYVSPFPPQFSVSGSNFSSQMVMFPDLDTWIEKVVFSCYVATTNDASNFWTITVSKSDAAAGSTSLGTVTTSAGTFNVRLQRSLTVGAALGGGTTYPVIFMSTAKTLGPGNLDFNSALVYRLIGT